MTGPSNVGGPPGKVDANKEVDPANNTSGNTSEDKYLVTCPQSTSLFHDPAGRFPDITPDGTTMTASEKDAAKESAKESRLILKTKKVEKGDS